MFFYKAYGLNIQSDLALPELVEGKEKASVRIRLGRVEQAPPATDDAGVGFAVTGEGAYYSLERVGTFLIRRGCEIIIDPVPGVEERALRLPLLGTALALLLYQRRRFVLHASAVAMHGSVVAFLGGRGWGKSTIAAALHARGYTIVADDMMAVSVIPDRPTVFPGFPQLKLWPDTLLSIGLTPEMLPQLHPLLEKRACRLSQGFARGLLPLKQIYVLAEGAEPGIDRLQPREAMIELVRHWYGARFGMRLLQATGATSWHFAQCAHLVNSVPISRLKRDLSLRALFALARLVEEDQAPDASLDKAI